MRKMLLILRREYVVRVRTKAFVLFTVLMPLLVGAGFVLPSKLMLRSAGSKRIVIVAADRELANSIKSELASSHASDDEDAAQLETRKSLSPEFNVSVAGPPSEGLRKQLTSEVREGKLDGFAWIEADAASTRKAQYCSRNASDFIEAQMVSRAFRMALSEDELTGHGFSAGEAKTLLGPVDVDTVRIDREGANRSNGLGAFLLPYFLLITIYVTVVVYGMYVMRSVIEEKSSRVVEILLGSVTPMQLMAGKIIGVGAVGLTQIGVWAVGAAVLGSGGMMAAREMLGDVVKDAHISTAAMVLFPVFFILGYATYSCLYAAVGAICNSEEEAQQLQFPVTFPLIVCMVCAMAIIRDPNTSLAFWLSMFPLTSPIIMYVRVSVSMPPTWQIAASIVISLTSLYGLVWLTSRIYRIGILMYGKRPTLPELLKWIRYA